MGIIINGQNDTIGPVDNSMSLLGTVSIGGTMTIEDFTNIDSVGLITARNGLHVTGGNVGINETSPQQQLHVHDDTAYHGIFVNGNAAPRVNFARDTTTTAEWSVGIDGTNGNNFAIAQAGNTAKLIIDTSGKIGINDSTPDNTLSIKGLGSFDADSNSFYFGSNFTGTGQNYIGSSKHAQRFFLNNASANGYFSYSNTGSAGNAGDAITWQERLRITSAGDLFVAGTGGMNTTQLPNGSTINVNGTSSNDGLSVIRYSTGYGAYGLNIGRSKSNTIGTNAAVTNGNDLGHITFYGADGTDFNQAAMITAQVDGTPSDGTDMPGRLVFKTSSDGSATPTERLRIASDGQATFDKGAVGGANQVIARFQAESSRRLDIVWHDSGSLLGFDLPGSHSYTFKTGGTERLRITSDGRLHVGDSLGNNHAGMFQVIHEGGGNQTNDCLAFFETNANDWCIITNSNEGGSANHYHMYFMEEGTVRGSIAGSHGQNVTYGQGSDYRYKENIIDLTGTEGIDICKRLRPRKYNWIKNREGTGQINTVDGFIAHEVQEAGVLGAVTGEKDAVKEDGSIDGQMLDYGQMTPVLAAGIKGLIAKVETLEAQNTDLLARVTALENP